MSPSLRKAARVPALTVAAAALVVAGSAPALARGGPGPGGGGGGGGGGRAEVRSAGTCGTGAASSLRLRSRDGSIRSEFWVHGRASSTWRVTIVHERVVAWRGKRRTAGPSHDFNLSYYVPDYSGADLVTARATGPRGIVCSASATLPG
jgi:hypothetical protein